MAPSYRRTSPAALLRMLTAPIPALTAGCAAGGGPPGHLFHPEPDLPPYCELSRDGIVPSVEEALVAESLLEWIRSRSDEVGGGAVVLSVQREGPSGEASGNWILAMESSLPPGETEALIRRVREALRPLPEVDPKQSYRLRLDLGPARLATGPSVHCLPHMWNAAEILERLMPVVREAAHAHGVQVVAEWVVERDGSSRLSRLVQGSGDAELDREIVAVLRRARFEPGQIDGHTLQVHAWVPFNLGPPR